MNAQHRRQAVTRRRLMHDALAAALLVSGALTARAGPAHGGSAAPARRVAANAPPTKAVDIRNFAFVPAQTTVAVGTRVVWTNRDDEAHLVASSDGAFKASPAMDTDDTFAMVFDRPGTYAYFCAIHPMMRGTIVVR
jgi:plastocyanin